MRRETIVAPAETDGGEGLLAVIVYRDGEPFPPGVSFVTEDRHPMQVATMRRKAGDVVRPHTHRLIPRKLFQVSETIVVVSGEMRLSVYTYMHGRHVKTVTLRAGDSAVLLGGGHSIEFVEETDFYEVKQGPYYGRETDKVEFTPDLGGEVVTRRVEPKGETT